MNKSDIIEKIKKLLEINRANGSTEAEEMAALDRANTLMEKYQIEQFQIKGANKTKNIVEKAQLDDGTLAFSNFRALVGDFFSVLALHSRSTYSYYGNAEQVKLAIDMTKRASMSECLGFTDYICSEEYRLNRKTAGRKIIKDSFHDGFFMRLCDRLEELIAQRQENIIKATGTNLVVMEQDNLRNSYSDDFGYKLEFGHSGRTRDVDFHAFNSGQEKGNEFRVLNEIK